MATTDDKIEEIRAKSRLRKDYKIQILCTYDTMVRFNELYYKTKRKKKFKNREEFLISMMNTYENAFVMDNYR